jgi:hypothetical protein
VVLMRLWATIHDAQWAQIGAGPVALRRASADRVLDGVGSISLDADGTDARAMRLLEPPNRARIWYDDGVSRREIGRGVIEMTFRDRDEGGWTLTADGADALRLIKDRIAYGTFDGTRLDVLASFLAGLAGWTAMIEPGVADVPVFDKYEGDTVLRAFMRINEITGLHFRATEALGGQIAVGAFGEVVPPVLINRRMGMSESDPLAEDVAVIDTVSLRRDGAGVYNWIEPIGGEGDEKFTLEESTRVAVKARAFPGRTVHYITAMPEPSLAEEVQRQVLFPELRLIDGSAEAAINGANMLHDAGQAWLRWNSVPREQYRISVTGCRKTVLPGDKIRVEYRGEIFDEDRREYVDGNVTGELFVTSVTERAAADGLQTVFGLSNVDRAGFSEERWIVEALTGGARVT